MTDTTAVATGATWKSDRRKRLIPIAIVTLPDGKEVTLFPTRPHILPFEA